MPHIDATNSRPPPSMSPGRARRGVLWEAAHSAGCDQLRPGATFTAVLCIYQHIRASGPTAARARGRSDE